MQLKSHVLQPLLLGRGVKLHPLAVVWNAGYTDRPSVRRSAREVAAPDRVARARGGGVVRVVP